MAAMTRKLACTRWLASVVLVSVGCGEPTAPRTRATLAPANANASVVATFTVTTASDAGAGSLRQAILDANTSAGLDLIAFSIPGPGRSLRQAACWRSRLEPAIIQAKVPDSAESLRARHERAGGWERVLVSTADCLRALGDDPPLTDETLGRIASGLDRQLASAEAVMQATCRKAILDRALAERRIDKPRRQLRA